jgi:electron transfer flavoprotein beta subunit
VGIKGLEIAEGTAIARREAAAGGWEIFEVRLPAVFTVKEGINLPRYPSVPGRLRAKKTEVERITPTPLAGGLERIRLRLPPEQEGQVEILGTGPDAAAAVVELLQRLGVVGR